VVDGSKPPVIAIGVALADLLGALQSIKPQDFTEVFQAKMHDLLMVSYLATLTQTQLSLAEKIHTIL